MADNQREIDYPMPLDHAARFLLSQTESYQTRCFAYWLSRGYPESFNNAVKKEMARKSKHVNLTDERSLHVAK